MAINSAWAGSDTLSKISGEFTDPQTERRFRADLSADAFRQSRVVFALGAIVSGVLLLAGVGFSHQPILDVLPARGAAIAASLICLLLAWQINARLLSPLMIAWQMAIILTSVVLMPFNMQTALVSIFLIPSLFYLVVPNSFWTAVVISLAGSVVLCATYFAITSDASASLMTAVSLATVNTMLAVFKSRSGRSLREQWAMTQNYGRALLKLDESHNLIARTFDAVPIPLLVTSVETGLISRANDAAESFLGASGQSIIGRQASEFHVDPAQRGAFAQMLRTQGQVSAFRANLKTDNQQFKTILLSASGIDAGAGAGQNMIACLYDVTESEERERRLNSAESEYRALFENAEVGIYRSTPPGKMLRANPALARLNGYGDQDELLSAVKDINSEWYVEAGRRQTWLKLMTENGRVTDFVSEVYRHKSRERIWVSENAWTFYDAKGQPAYFEGTIVEATERKRAEAEIEHLARHDPLTDLPNRRLFMERLEGAFAPASRNGRAFAVMCLDLDRFKAVNDAFGHSAGDLLLKEAARRIRLACRLHDTVARFGGDEFVVLATQVTEPDVVAVLASRIIKAFDAPFALDGHRALVGVSIGIAIAQADDDDPQTLIKNADRALYRAKDEGKKTFRFFDPAIKVRTPDISDAPAYAAAQSGPNRYPRG